MSRPLVLIDCVDPVGRIKREAFFDGGFRKEIFEIILKYIKRNCDILQLIASTKKLDKERLDCNILRNNLEIRHLRLTNSHIK